MEKQASKNRLQFLAQDKLNELGTQTHDDLNDKQSLQLILKKHQAKDLKTFDDTVVRKINVLQEETYKYAFTLVSCLGLFLVAWLIMRKKNAAISLFIYNVCFDCINCGALLSHD